MTSKSSSNKASLSATDEPAVLDGTHGDCGNDCLNPRRGRPSVAEARLLFDRILEASWQVLLAHGFENFTFDRVARHARIGKATIYSRFAGKTDLMRALLTWRVERQRTQIMAESSAMEPVEAFTFRAQRVLEVLFSPDGMLLERLIDWVDLEAGAGNARGEVYRSALQSIAQEFAELNEAGRASVPNVDLAARFWLEGLLGHARLAASEGAEGLNGRAEWAREYAQFFFRGIDGMVNRS
ncbi:TetR/AcrR family transcriptional regulator [Novosphingobium olei]|uniref:TetR/AcrR family transcriptional regulator n=1 Tax=Novosphingobium olei TaxID=2728851 RepID=UPI00308FD440|nr:TetR/AcrR family transcriptional regulator [Novosphingobium olei]